MIRRSLGIIFFLFIAFSSNASHITGGEMSYILVGQSGNSYTYKVTLKLFSDAYSSVLPGQTASIGIFDRITNAVIMYKLVDKTGFSIMTLASPNPCVISPPIVSYWISSYEFDVTLPGSLNGYIISYQACCRINGIANVIGSSSTGITYCAEIPGQHELPSAAANNGAHFLGIDTVMICAGYPFSYNFGADDADGDSLVYSFINAYNNTAGASPSPAPPPYSPMVYYAPTYTGNSPLGSGVAINTSTGLITGMAPVAGIYVVTVCVKEFRNGILIATQRKELQVKISDCDIAKVTLEPNGYINCDNYSLSFSNLTPSSLISSYFWDFGDLTTTADTSRLTTPNYTYPDTGIYTLKVIVNRNQPCADSTTAQVKVYPGFTADFDFRGICINVPVVFNDLTTATYGTVNSWRYDFGVTSILNDTSSQQHPQYSYFAPGNYTMRLIAESNKGCRDTIYKSITIYDKLPVSLSFHDTLICNVDTLQLNASGIGAVSWSPNYNIIDVGSGTLVVFPKSTTTYKVEFNEYGCRNADSVIVRVTDRVNLSVINDTSICLNDPVQLFANTDGLQYTWSPDPTLNNLNILNPIATPTVTTTYLITAKIGGCTAIEDVKVVVVPRPTVDAGMDKEICYNSIIQLNAQTNGTTFSWHPSSSLSDLNSLNPVASPLNTTSYILSALTSGCSKPTFDTVIVRVFPKVNAFAGKDTIIFPGIPLQLKATGGIKYQWSPTFGLDNPAIADPIARLNGSPSIITYKVLVTDQSGCVDSANITVSIHKTGPEIFVPTGFTPNNDGRNDVFRPTYLGMKTIDFFRVYDRWGKLIFSNNMNDGKGWDGTINGVKQNIGTFIWMVQATDIAGKVHFKKGTVMLIR